MNQETRTCQNCKQNFVIEPEDFAFYERIKVPPPTWCPECRMVRRHLFRNERSFYKRKCDGTGKEIISIFSINKPFKVYESSYWLSDNWDPMIYGQDYDFSQSFFEQLKKLMMKVPWQSFFVTNCLNSDYCNHCTNLKNSYLTFSSVNSEDLFYSNRITEGYNSMDLYRADKVELCYENVFCSENYRLFWSSYSYNCANSYFLFNCR